MPRHLNAFLPCMLIALGLAAPAQEREPKERTQEEVATLWKDLAGADAVKADRAVWALAASPKAAVAFLDKHLRPPAKIPTKQIAKLIANLDAKEFEVRQQATAKLEALGDVAEGELRRALSANPPLELRRRAEGLLARLKTKQLTPQRLRFLRGLRALELIGTPEAREVVAAVAKESADTWHKRQAQAALERLDRNLRGAP